MSVEDAVAWIDQARSDARTAEQVRKSPRALARDIGCHVALLCAQSFEKCIKGCMFLVGQTPTMTHAIDARIDAMLEHAEAFSRRDARRRLREVFSERAVRGTVRMLLAWAPRADATLANYEYPWRPRADAELERPYAHALFEDAEDHAEWTRVAQHLAEETAKIAEAAVRAP